MPDLPVPLPARPSLDQLRKQAKNLLRQCHAGDTEAAARVRAVILRPADERLDDLALADMQFVLAREYGFESWAALAQHVAVRRQLGDPESAAYGMSAAPPFYRIDWPTNTIEPRPPLSTTDWTTIVDVMKALDITGLNANGAITDDALERVSRLRHVTRLDLSDSKALTDDGLRHLARIPQLEEVDLSGWQGQLTDRGLAVFRQLPALTSFQMTWNSAVTDAGIVHLSSCERLEHVNLMGTHTGDGVLTALAGKSDLRRLRTGRGVTDEGLAWLHHFPMFKRWGGEAITYSLMEADAGPTHLMLDGPFTDKGLTRLVGLDGLFALSLFWHSKAFTPDGLAALVELPNLGFFACPAELSGDMAMRRIAALPHLRMLLAQGTVATDAGFEALSRSRTIEYIWGRDAAQLTNRGFMALAAMPALRGLAVSCKRVDEAALSMLPQFPVLRELVPMDVSDEGFRHIGRCNCLEALWCMYCRDTTDLATEQIKQLALKTYYAGRTKISDRSLDVLSRMPSLERITLWQTTGVTDAGVTALAGLPLLRELTLNGLPNVTREAIAAFPPEVRVHLSSP